MVGIQKRFMACAAASLALAMGCRSSYPSPAGGPDASPIAADRSGASDAGNPMHSTLDAAAVVAARPYTLYVPAGYDAKRAAPLVVMFHGFGASGDLEEDYMGLTATSEAHSFLYAYPDGTIDPTGRRFWNATDACCDLHDIPVDDVHYFDAMVADIESRYNVDRKRIFAIGHSNGGFLSHRLACDRASTVAAILSLAGAQWNDATKCSPSNAVSVAEVHGDADPTILYAGGKTDEGTYPSAPVTVADWAQKNGCTGALAPTGRTYDVDSALPGSETQVQAYAGCPAGIDVQLWVIRGGSHIPTLTAGWGERVWGFLSAHPKR
jgi:polyhydroxybutyrate depolymerase